MELYVQRCTQGGSMKNKLPLTSSSNGMESVIHCEGIREVKHRGSASVRINDCFKRKQCCRQWKGN